MRHLISFVLASVFFLFAGAPRVLAQPTNVPAVHVVNSPNTLAWPATTRLTSIEVTANGVRPVFDRCETWPDVTPPGWGGPLRFTLHLFLNIGGTWWESGIIQFWACDQYNGGPIYDDNQIARNWVYDTRWGDMVNHQPAPGELIGFMVSAGNARGQDDHGVAERSNIVAIRTPAAATTFTTPFAWEEGAASPLPGPPAPAPPAPTPAAHEGVLVPLVQALAARVDQLYALEAEQSRADGEAHAVINTNVSDGRAENRSFFASVGDHW